VYLGFDNRLCEQKDYFTEVLSALGSSGAIRGIVPLHAPINALAALYGRVFVVNLRPGNKFGIINTTPASEDSKGGAGHSSFLGK